MLKLYGSQCPVLRQVHSGDTLDSHSKAAAATKQAQAAQCPFLATNDNKLVKKADKIMEEDMVKGWN